MDKFIFSNEKKQPNSVYWIPQEGLKYPPIKKSGSKWLIFSQSTLNLQPQEGKIISLHFGYMMSEGIIAISPAEELKQTLGIMNSVFIDHKTQNIQIYVFNFSKKNNFIIPENSPFCFVQYLKS